MFPDFILPESVAHARVLQESLRKELSLTNRFTHIDTIAGIDVGYDTTQGLAKASIVVMKLSDLRVYEQIQIAVPVHFPYIPGLLSFREIPALLAGLAKLSSLPDLLMVDGQGIAHPRRMGIASHLGIALDRPAIGVAKSRLTGQFIPPGPLKGSHTPLMAGNEQIGTVLRSKDKTNPLFISPGQHVDMETSVAIVLQCITRYRLPEPTRLADKYSKHTHIVEEDSLL